MEKKFIYWLLFVFVLPVFAQESIKSAIDEIIAKEKTEENTLLRLKQIDPNLDDSLSYLAELMAKKETAKQAIRVLKKIDPHWNKTNAVKKIVPQLAANFKAADDYKTRTLFCECLGEIGCGAYEAIPELVFARVTRRGVWDPPTGSTLEKIEPQWHKLPIARQTMLQALKSTPYDFFTSVDHMIREMYYIDPNWPNAADVRDAIPDIVRGLKVTQEGCARTAIKLLKTIDPKWAELQVKNSMPDSFNSMPDS
ncbi:hypothetical protein [Candidatus Uabimicrobium sp. HlEnr_7]|uniref:hypothetical protein n=1 Tax=Candidatus Uabimicrobium helgolandensis TaxID=3095367 RepID=UPI0035562662